MGTRLLWICILSGVCSAGASTWNNLNCPAPRAPDNGLSFIFRDGEMVHFRCHPGYSMQGRSVAYCINNVWSETVPKCVPFINGSLSTQWRHERAKDSSFRDRESRRHLFNWGNETNGPSVYGDGPRRLPLINGIWPPVDQVEEVLSLGPQSTPGPKIMVKEEIDIAELRNKQLEDLKKHRYKDYKHTSYGESQSNPDHAFNSVLINSMLPRETVVSLAKTEDGDALSVALSKPNLEKPLPKRRHRSGKRKLRFLAPNLVLSRASRVDTSGYLGLHGAQELRQRPVAFFRVPDQLVAAASLAEFDASCIESLHGRDVPMLAPQVPYAFVYRYETKKNKLYPFNRYMLVRYRCLNSFTFANSNATTLHCKESRWGGEMPQCIKRRSTGY